ncbi:MAG: ATP-binding protein [Thermodesulfobacteriota bacterium]
MADWIRSETGSKFLLALSICLMAAIGVLLYETRVMVHEFETAFAAGQDRIPGTAAGELRSPETPEPSVDTIVESRLSRFLVVILLLLAGLSVITLLFSLKHLLKPFEDSDPTRLTKDELLAELDELADEDDEPDDDPLPEAEDLDEDPEAALLAVKQLHILKEEREDGAIAHSYNKMVEALQKINELEKKHTRDLSAANKQLEKEIAEREKAEREIRHLSRQLITGIEEAQKKLAQDLHDEFGQTLAALHMGVETLWNSIPDEMGDQKNSINELIGLIEQLGDKIRSISSDLRPDLLDDLGLAPTLEWYIKEFQEQRTDLKIDFQAVGFKKRATPEIELVLYRIFQESLTNIVKHAKARQVTVMLTFNYPKVILMVKDDGVGFDPTQRYGGIGLIGMRERAVSVGGFIDIRSEKGKGTTIRVEMPVS